MITALGGGVGAAKFLKGLSAVLPPEELNIIVNTGDDIDIYGFRISPDIDTVLYRLSDKIDRSKGWGLEDDTFRCLETLSDLGHETWFGLGDKDFAVQVFKQDLRKQGLTVSEITNRLAGKLGLHDLKILPMSDDPVETWIDTDRGLIHFQEYYIRYSMSPKVRSIVFRGASGASPAPNVIESIIGSDIIIICPSNPVISIGPILEINGIRKALIDTRASTVAVSPLIGGRPLKGPADRLMKGLGMEVSSKQIAKIYSDFLDVMVIDETDAEEKAGIEETGIKTLTADTVMSSDDKSENLSRIILRYLDAT